MLPNVNMKRTSFYLALYATLNFDSHKSAKWQINLLKIASDITFRQIVIFMSLVHTKQSQLVPKRRDRILKAFQGYEKISIASEILDFISAQFVFSQKCDS